MQLTRTCRTSLSPKARALFLLAFGRCRFCSAMCTPPWLRLLRTWPAFLLRTQRVRRHTALILWR